MILTDIATHNANMRAQAQTERFVNALKNHDAEIAEKIISGAWQFTCIYDRRIRAYCLGLLDHSADNYARFNLRENDAIESPYDENIGCTKGYLDAMFSIMDKMRQQIEGAKA